MKKILTMTCLCLSISAFTATNTSTGTADVDRQYVDELKTLDSSQQKRIEKTREKFEENPRNPAMVESFGQLHSKEDDQQREEVRKQEKKEPGAVYDD